MGSIPVGATKPNTNNAPFSWYMTIAIIVININVKTCPTKKPMYQLF